MTGAERVHLIEDAKDEECWRGLDRHRRVRGFPAFASADTTPR
ncbi:hypothetical protein [Nocardia sp. GTS18]|nr:hypothetical protein [Nocardia sp. GTS18]